MNCGLDVQRHTSEAHYKNIKSHPIQNNKYQQVQGRLPASFRVSSSSIFWLGTFWNFLLKLVIFQGRGRVGISNKYLQPHIFYLSRPGLIFFYFSPNVLSALNMYQSLICRRPLQPFHLEKNDKNGSAWVSNLLNFLNVNKSLFLLPLAHIFFSTGFFATVQYWTVFVKIQSLQLTKKRVLILATDLWLVEKSSLVPDLNLKIMFTIGIVIKGKAPNFGIWLNVNIGPIGPQGVIGWNNCLTFSIVYHTTIDM